jgi:hypothetical protein
MDFFVILLSLFFSFSLLFWGLAFFVFIYNPEFMQIWVNRCKDGRYCSCVVTFLTHL